MTPARPLAPVVVLACAVLALGQGCEDIGDVGQLMKQPCAETCRANERCDEGSGECVPDTPSAGVSGAAAGSGGMVAGTGGGGGEAGEDDSEAGSSGEGEAEQECPFEDADALLCTPCEDADACALLDFSMCIDGFCVECEGEEHCEAGEVCEHGMCEEGSSGSSEP